MCSGTRNASSDHECVETRKYDPMTIFFTSGTTGSPRMTQPSRSSYGIGLTVNGRYWSGLTERDVLWNMSDTCEECYIGDFGVVMDEDGYLGYHIGPYEVESALIEHQAVAESAVVCSPNPIRGETVTSFCNITTTKK
ncbi:acyl-coenzyme A synthetase ACSM4, mitochondrial-like [Salmo trutta]|uniref:acyl-coenzyme A synthetase ACSM4, mitochondrial-like n=1 Tax=Salmo trutta TaxID=8032 RepID=UPI001131F753|nr:acyl-coenzyme A synthetase ACSM4, mitochondrial-like [Salmo trutta]